jgi:hypothetical protein
MALQLRTDLPLVSDVRVRQLYRTSTWLFICHHQAWRMQLRGVTALSVSARVLLVPYKPLCSTCNPQAPISITAGADQ